VHPPRGLGKVLLTHFRAVGPKIVRECEAIVADPKACGYSSGYGKCLERLLPRLRSSLLRFELRE